MILLTAATDFEMQPLTQLIGKPDGVCCLLTGVGCLETTLTLTRFLASAEGKNISRIVNFGVGGVFPATGRNMLDICLAESECLADFGVVHGEYVESFTTLKVPVSWPVDQTFLTEAVASLQQFEGVVHKGPFLTVNAVSATDERALYFQGRYGALCENMEGAAVVRVGAEFGLPCLEMRAASNFVEKRNPAAWKLIEAAEQCAKALAHLLNDTLLTSTCAA